MIYTLCVCPEWLLEPTPYKGSGNFPKGEIIVKHIINNLSSPENT